MNCGNSIGDSSGYNSRLCSWHTCRRADCSEQSRTDKFNSPYCAHHRCITSRCHGEAKVPNGCCPKEACVLLDCGLPKASPYDQLCVYHRSQSAQTSYLPSPTETVLRPTIRYKRPDGSQTTSWLPWSPVPPGMPMVVGSSPRSGSRDHHYAQVDNAYRYQRRGC